MGRRCIAEFGARAGRLDLAPPAATDYERRVALRELGAHASLLDLAPPASLDAQRRLSELLLLLDLSHRALAPDLALQQRRGECRGASPHVVPRAQGLCCRASSTTDPDECNLGPSNQGCPNFHCCIVAPGTAT